MESSLGAAEFAASNANSIFVCGDVWLEAYALQRIYEEFTAHPEDDKKVVDVLSCMNLWTASTILDCRSKLHNGQTQKLTPLLTRRRRVSFGANRPHDTIFALLALVNPVYGFGIPIDYSKPEEQLFKEVASPCLRVENNLDLLYIAAGHNKVGLPSWAPNCAQSAHPRSFFTDILPNSSKDSRSWVDFSFDLSILIVEGIQVDQVVESAETVGDEPYDHAEITGQLQGFATSWVETLARGDPNVSINSETFWRTMTAEFSAGYVPSPKMLRRPMRCLLNGGFLVRKKDEKLYLAISTSRYISRLKCPQGCSALF